MTCMSHVQGARALRYAALRWVRPRQANNLMGFCYFYCERGRINIKKVVSRNLRVL